MKRILTCLLLTAVLLTACAAPSSSGSSSEVTFTDDLGREVTVAAPQRVAALLGSYADMWVLAGGTVCASADDAWEEFHLPVTDDTVNLGNTKKLSMEALLAAEPDFIIASTNTSQHREWQPTLESLKIPVAYFNVRCFEDYLRVLKICTEITGNSDAYQTYGEDLKVQIDEMISAHPEEKSQSVLVMRASASSIRAKNSDGTVLGTILRDFGCTNIADSDDSLLENLNAESILLQNPDKIFLVQSGDDLEGAKENIEDLFRENPMWQQLDAVKSGNVYYMEKELYNLKPNSRWAEAYRKVEDILYGE